MVPRGLALREAFRQHGPRGPERERAGQPREPSSAVPPTHNRAVCMRTALSPPPIPPAQNRRYACFRSVGACFVRHGGSFPAWPQG